MRVRYDMVTCYVVRSTADSTSAEFLQLRRAPADFMGGTWQAVSGGMQADETASGAALRELREETGVIPLEFYRLPVVNTFYIAEQDTLWHSIPFCAIVGPEQAIVLNHEHDAIRWVKRGNVKTAFMWATDRAAIAELCDSILDGSPAKPHLRIPLK